jgi:predicted NAD/FAD-dependent oxidoreductase
MLGAPIAAQACRKPLRTEFDGTIVGQDVTHAHLLRDPARTSQASWDSITPERVQTVIVGGGPSGLSCAWKLSQNPRRSLVVLELESKLGGTSAWGENSTSAYPWGAHYVPAPGANNTRLIALLCAMGIASERSERGSGITIGEQYLVRDLDERVWVDGQWRENLLPNETLTESDRRDIAAFQATVDRLVQFRDSDGRRAFAIPTRESSEDASILALDHVTMSEWVAAQGLRSPKLKWLIDYACRDDYGLKATQTSAWAGLFYFASRQDRAQSAPRELLAFPEGNGRFVQWFASQLTAAERRTQTLVTQVIVRADQLIETRAIDLRTNRALRWLSETAVLAIPHFVARTLLRRDQPGVTTPLSSALDGLKHSPWLVANLTLSDRPRVDQGGVEMAWDNVLFDSPALGYVCATHQQATDYGPTVLTWYLPFTSENPSTDRARLFAMTHRECAAVVMADLTRAHPDLPSLVTRLDVQKWGHAMVRPTVATRALIQRAHSVSTSAEGILFAHTERAGVALFEEALEQGWSAAEQATTLIAAKQSVATLGSSEPSAPNNNQSSDAGTAR